MTILQEKPRLALDVGGYFPLKLEGDCVAIDLRAGKSRYLRPHLASLLQVTLDGVACPLEVGDRPQLRYLLPAAQGEILLRMNGQPVGQLRLADGKLEATEAHGIYALALSETRALGRPLRADVLAMLPYDRARRAGFDVAKHVPITDVHTHASAQIKAADLLAAAIEIDRQNRPPILYPAGLLTMLGAPPEPGQALHPYNGVAFNPTQSENQPFEQPGVVTADGGIRVSELTARQQAALVAQMDIAADMTISFSHFDREIYRFRNPLAKHPALTRSILRRIADDYAAMGVRYAELSTGSMMNPHWFRAMAETVQQIEEAGGPKLRFLVGIPRNASPQQTLVDIEKIKYLARHPYIVGVDLLGYESNRTSDFNWALSNLAQWATASEGTASALDPQAGWDFKRDFILRVHAGETGKNESNVSDAIHLAAEHGVRLRIGHGLHVSLDARAQADLAAITQHDDQFATERCMDSNQAFRTKILPHNQPPFLQPAQHFLGTDGAGALGTTPHQLAFSALAAGLTLEALAHIRAYEEGYIARQAAREQRKTEAFHSLYSGLDDFLRGYEARVAALPVPVPPPVTHAMADHTLPPVFRMQDGAEKTPILIGGASGSSWAKMGVEDKEAVIRCIELLVHSCDPQKTYFVLGRVQRTGVSKTLDYAVKQWNAAHPENKFAVLGRFNGAAGEPTADLAETINWVQNIPGGRDAVPGSMVEFLHAHGGKAIFFDGSDFTAEMAYGCEDAGVAYAAQDPAQRSVRMSEVAENITAPTFTRYEDFAAQVLNPVGEGKFFRSAAEQRAMLRGDVTLASLIGLLARKPLDAEQRLQAQEH